MKQIELLVPKLGMDAIEATVASWLVCEGDRVEKGTPLVELETEKVSFVVESEVDGIVARFIQQVGAVVPVRDALAILETEWRSGTADGAAVMTLDL